MNRRLMMAQQNKGFELVYDAASGTLPKASDGWVFTSNGNTTTTVRNGYLKISGDGSWLQPRATLEIEKPQDLTKSKEVVVTVGNVYRFAVRYQITEPWFYIEDYARPMILVYTTFSTPLFKQETQIKYQTIKSVYNASTKTISYYLNDTLIFTETNSIPKKFKLEFFGEHFLEVSQITYKEW